MTVNRYRLKYAFKKRSISKQEYKIIILCMI